MDTYCVSSKKNTVNKNSRVRRTEENIFLIESTCAIYGKKKSRITEN